MTTQPVPITDDIDTGGFWDAAKAGRLAIRYCPNCGTWVHLPRMFCPACHHRGTTWQQVRGLGRLYTWAIVEQQIDPAFPAPYTLVVVSLVDAPDVRLIGRLDGAPELAADMPMEIVFDALTSDIALPQWRPCV
jgi:uncharacterized protein